MGAAPFSFPHLSYWARRQGLQRRVTEGPSLSSHAISCDASNRARANPLLLQRHRALVPLNPPLSTPPVLSLPSRLILVRSTTLCTLATRLWPHWSYALATSTTHLIGRTTSSSATVPSPASSPNRGDTTYVVGLEVRRDLGLCAIAIGKELLLVVQQLFAGLGGVLGVLGCRMVSVSLRSVQSSQGGYEEEPIASTHSRRWRRRGTLPGRNRSRCTWSYRCLRRSVSSTRHHLTGTASDARHDEQR